MQQGRLITFLFLIFLTLVTGNAVSASGDVITLSVDRAVTMALEENLNLRLQKSETEGAKGDETAERGAFDPRIEAGISNAEQRMRSLLAGDAEKENTTVLDARVTKKLKAGTEVGLFLENSRFDTDSELIGEDTVYSSAIGVSISQPLLRGNRREIQTAGVRAAEKISQAVQYVLEDQAAELAADVKKAYWELVFARQDIEVKQLSLKLAMNLRDEISRKIEHGVLAEVEIYQPDSEIARREEFLIAAERNIANAEDSLKLLINSKNWSASMVPEDTPEIIMYKPDLQDVLANALSRRQDIKAGNLRVDAAEIMVDKAEDDLKPSLVLGGSSGIHGDNDNHGDALNNMFSDSEVNWNIGLTFQLPLGNRSAHGGLARARAERAKASLRAELLRQEVSKSAREAVRDVTVALKTIEATKKTSIAHQKRLEAEQEKFRVGLATANDVLEFQDSYAQALINEKRALIDLARAQAELDRVQGMVSFRN